MKKQEKKIKGDPRRFIWDKDDVVIIKKGKKKKIDN